MTFQIEWSIEGEKQLSRRLRGISTKATNFTKPFTSAAQHLTGVFSREVFNTEGGVIGEKWARLSPATVARKARLGQSTRPLIATGRMRSSFRNIVSSDQAVIYNNSDYFKYHQSNKPRRKIPRRVMMKLGLNQRTDVVRIFQTHLRKAMQ